MIQIFLASHGRFASGMKSSMDILLGANFNVTVFDGFVDEQNINDVLAAYFRQVTPGSVVVMCSDLYGGSVNTQMALYGQRPDVFLVAGVNMAFVLELACRDTIDKAGIKQLITESRQALRLVEFDDQPEETAEDFFTDTKREAV